MRRYRDALYALPPMPAHDATRVIVWNPDSVLELPHGALAAATAEGRGLSVDRCADARVEEGEARCRSVVGRGEASQSRSAVEGAGCYISEIPGQGRQIIGP